MAEVAISIIIPAYNVESWVRRAVESLQAQTFTDFEIIIVDDGCTDATPEICDELAASDSRIRVIHQKNAGAAQARNNAMDVSRGEYIYFMDADDWCEPEMLQEMYDFAEKNTLDLVVCGFTIDTYYKDDKFFRELRTAPGAVFESAESFREASCELFDAQLLYAPWNKLYRRSYLESQNIKFPKTFWDDLPFNLDVIRNIQRVGTMNKRFYHFLRARQEAENTRYRPGMYEKREEENEWLHQLYDGWGLNTPQIQEFLGRRYIERLLGCIENITCADCSLTSSEKRDEVKKMITAPAAVDAIKVAVPKTFVTRQLYKPLRAQNVGATLRQSSFISWVKRNNTNMFARLKARR